MISRYSLVIALAAILCSGSSRAQSILAGPPPDARMKCDILLIVAHPDDETAVGSYLARAIFDEHKRVGVIYCNRGNGGGNTVGGEQSFAMAAIREIEARQATAAFGITNIWFLGGIDTPGQDPFASLQRWHQGEVLEQVVRLIRLTRADVVLTWLPHVVSGENHGDHQAAGVIATEGFDMAGDPTRFPVQVAVPRERLDIGNAGEGLLAWQPKKLYFFSDASHEVVAQGPPFNCEDVSPAKGEPYYRLAARLHLPHLTQGDVSESAIEAFKTGNFAPLKEWVSRIRLIFGKAVVACAPDGGVFDGVADERVPFAPVPGYRPASRRGLALELGGVFSFYRAFWPAHAIERVAPLVAPESEVIAGGYMHVPLLVTNATSDMAHVTLTAVLPAGWSDVAGAGTCTVPPHGEVPVQTMLKCASDPTTQSVDVTWVARAGKTEIGRATVKVKLSEWTLPQ
jgi:LmbE family N-acetylglucosaminyl deacetylase